MTNDMFLPNDIVCMMCFYKIIRHACREATIEVK